MLFKHYHLKAHEHTEVGRTTSCRITTHASQLHRPTEVLRPKERGVEKASETSDLTRLTPTVKVAVLETRHAIQKLFTSEKMVLLG